MLLVIKDVQNDMTRKFEEYVKKALIYLFKVISEEEDESDI